ncbi:MAG: DUF5615 family PIN-like protein [Desulfomonilaceae bacterium]
MRFLVDECTGPAVARWLRDQGFQVFSVYDEAPGTDDESIVQKAFLEDWILITNDKDFGGRNLPRATSAQGGGIASPER